MMNKRKTLCALGMLTFCDATLGVFIIAADEQSIRSSGSPAPDRISLKELMAHGPGKNRHVELTDFYFSKQHIYTTKLVQFNEVYVPMFPRGEPETASDLQFLFGIQNDRNSNQPLIQSGQELDQSVEEFNRHPRSVTGILRTPIDRVRTLTAEAYPGVHDETLQALWARSFPTQQSVNIIWIVCALCLLGAAVCAFAYKSFATKVRFERRQ
jgi:hypothetical protein